MRGILIGLYGDWLWLDKRIGDLSGEIEEISRTEENCANIMTIPGIGPMISTAMVAAVGKGEAFDRGQVSTALGFPRVSTRAPLSFCRRKYRSRARLRDAQRPRLSDDWI